MRVYAELKRAILRIPYGPFLPDGRPCLRPSLPSEVGSGAIRALEISGFHSGSSYPVDIRFHVPARKGTIDLLLRYRDVDSYHDHSAVRDDTWRLLFRITAAIDYALGYQLGLPTRYPKIPRTAARCLFQPEGVWSIKHEQSTVSDLTLATRVPRWPRWLTERTHRLLAAFPRLEEMVATIDYQPRTKPQTPP